ncbi:unnamed protein product [Heligmosomoides polygyrus]|uniref:Homeodomain GLABROUS 2 n=1 Tax=Heligmosomoides polygyrus TaxID=6339 RepID=A0A183GPC2_HELPZ|nr:unnamed protein product [Heligmosomoides polygyrus]
MKKKLVLGDRHGDQVVTKRMVTRSGSRTRDFEEFTDDENINDNASPRGKDVKDATMVAITDACSDNQPHTNHVVAKTFNEVPRDKYNLVNDLEAVAHNVRMPQRSSSTAKDTDTSRSNIRPQELHVVSQGESCKLVPIVKKKSHLLGNVWISDSKEFALSWSENSPRSQDCSVDLVMSDQGYAEMTTSMVPR